MLRRTVIGGFFKARATSIKAVPSKAVRCFEVPKRRVHPRLFPRNARCAPQDHRREEGGLGLRSQPVRLSRLLKGTLCRTTDGTTSPPPPPPAPTPPPPPLPPLPSTSASGFRYVTRAYSKEHAAAHAEQFACMLTRAASGYAYQPAGCCTYQRHRAACPGRAVHTAYRGTPGSPPWPRCTNSAPTCWRSVRTCSMPRAGTAAARTRWASAQRSRRCCGTTACSARSRRVCYRGLQPQTSRQSQAGLLYSHACASPRTGFEAQQLRIVFPWRDAFQPNAKQAEAAPALP